MHKIVHITLIISEVANFPANLYLYLINNNLKYPFKHKDSSASERTERLHPIQNL